MVLAVLAPWVVTCGSLVRSVAEDASLFRPIQPPSSSARDWHTRLGHLSSYALLARAN